MPWRKLEQRLIAALRYSGARVIDSGSGEPILVVEIFDENDGQSLSVRRILSVEALARALEHIA